MSVYLQLETRIPAGFQTRHTLLMRVVAPAPRAARARTNYHVDNVWDVAILSDGSIVSASALTLSRWDPVRGDRVWSFPLAYPMSHRLALAPVTGQLVLAQPDGGLCRVDPNTGALQWLAQGLHYTSSLGFSRDGGSLLWCGSRVPGNPGGFSSADARVWDAESWQERWAWAGPDWDVAIGAAFDHGGRRVAVLTDRGLITRLARETGTVLSRTNVGMRLEAAALNPRTENFIAQPMRMSQQPHDPLRRWGMGSGVPSAIAERATGTLLTLAPRRRIALAALGARVDLVDLGTLAVLDTIVLPELDLDCVTCMTVSPGEDSFILGTVRGALLQFAFR